MTTEEIAKKYYELAQKGQWQEIQSNLYSENASSVEKNQEGKWNSVDGIEAIQEKGRQWAEGIVESHGGYCNEPIVAGNHFSCTMGMDITTKQGRMQMDEVCVFEVKDGKIVKEQFFY